MSRIIKMCALVAILCIACHFGNVGEIVTVCCIMADVILLATKD